MPGPFTSCLEDPNALRQVEFSDPRATDAGFGEEAAANTVFAMSEDPLSRLRELIRYEPTAALDETLRLIWDHERRSRT